jgi:Ca-activated chloride channel homolog
VSFLTYRDPADQQGYYQISIYSSPRAKELEVLPKEIIFLVDASLSIQRRRLHAFREGIKHAIVNLNPRDRFNIFVFKNDIIPFAVESVSTRPESVQKAMDFLDRIEPSNRTDIYSAFFETIQKPAALDPSYIVLLSDGKPSEGELSSVKLISEITRRNALKRPIFAFSGGARVNRFLLDFLAYPNRGWSEFAAYDSQIQKKFSALYDKIQNPILSNMRYQLTPLDESQAYPKNLPDFYRDTLFTVYGTFRDETRFSIRILGEEGGRKKEFIFSHDLKEAQQGTAEIAKHWAFNKVYFLISQMTLHGPTEAEKQEVRRLTEKFGLNIPYDIDQLV